MTATPATPRRLLWITAESQGGIASYSHMLWPAIASAADAAGDFVPLRLVQTRTGKSDEAISVARDLAPDLVHVQHEYGLFGGLNPVRDHFPRWMRHLRQAVPATTRIVATAHSVMNDYRFDTTTRDWRTPFHHLANRFALQSLRHRWGMGTLGTFDAVIVHSGLQRANLQADGFPVIAEIPHLVPAIEGTRRRREAGPSPVITVFGYFSPGKGQDIAIEAMRHLRIPAQLRLAGGVGQPAHRVYGKRCEDAIERLGLRGRVEMTGYVPDAEISRVYEESDLVLAPFRMTTGSGSLVQALARGAPVLASDLPLNRELNQRVSDTLAFFVSEDPGDCARQIERLLTDRDRRNVLCAQARQYAATYSPANISKLHLDLYRRILAG
jgi:glycosyltransferase involved in cell wall biosynthesis